MDALSDDEIKQKMSDRLGYNVEELKQWVIMYVSAHDESTTDSFLQLGPPPGQEGQEPSYHSTRISGKTSCDYRAHLRRRAEQIRRLRHLGKR